MDKGTTSKNAEIGDIRLTAIPHCNRSPPVESIFGHLVVNMRGSLNGQLPEAMAKSCKVKHRQHLLIMVQLNLSAHPFCIGASGAERLCLIPEDSKKCLNSAEVNSPPQSEWNFLIVF
jgi:hypothetical protein